MDISRAGREKFASNHRFGLLRAAEILVGASVVILGAEVAFDDHPALGAGLALVAVFAGAGCLDASGFINELGPEDLTGQQIEEVIE